MIGFRGSTPETARFVPSPVKEMMEALYDLERFIGERRSGLPFLVQLALVHHQFEVIHPFMDGNGRIGRLLIALQLQEREYLPQPLLYLSGYFERHHDAYAAHLLEVSRSGAWASWVDFFLRGVAEQANDTIRRAHEPLDLLETSHAWALAESRSGNLAVLVESLFEQPVVAIADVQERLGVTPRAASQLIQRLVNRGIVTEVTGRRRNRLFAAEEIVRIVSSHER